MSDAGGLAADLKIAFERLAAARLDAAARAALQQRLIAITNAAKHDVGRARERLDGWFAALDEAEPSPE